MQPNERKSAIECQVSWQNAVDDEALREDLQARAQLISEIYRLGVDEAGLRAKLSESIGAKMATVPIHGRHRGWIDELILTSNELIHQMEIIDFVRVRRTELRDMLNNRVYGTFIDEFPPTGKEQDDGKDGQETGRPQETEGSSGQAGDGGDGIPDVGDSEA